MATGKDPRKNLPRWDTKTRLQFARIGAVSNPSVWNAKDRSERVFAANMYNIGFVRVRGIPTEARQAARREFFNAMGIDPRDFDWTAWRRSMGYPDD